jgi:hypothetical protein
VVLNIEGKPMKRECPQRYCFHWAKAGSWIETSSDAHVQLEEAMRSDTLRQVTEDGCAAQGTCARNPESPGNEDLYVPAEDELDKDGLPVDQFLN